jgi:hypothetical protein
MRLKLVLELVGHYSKRVTPQQLADELVCVGSNCFGPNGAHMLLLQAIEHRPRLQMISFAP